MKTATLKTELVDWKVLSGQGDRNKSDELMRHVATLFSLTAEHCTDEQLATYDTVMQRLADLVCEETRSFAAKKLSTLGNAPHQIVRRFAFDAIAVANPVLKHSPVLTDQDLIEVSDVKGKDHMVAICFRKQLSCVVTDVLIESEHGSVLIKLAANTDAEISPIGMRVLKNAAANDQALAKELSRRDKVNGVEDVKAAAPLKRTNDLSVASLWKDIEAQVPGPLYDLSMHSYLARYRFESSLNKIDKLERQGVLDKGILRQYASNDQFADVVCGIARMSGFPHQIVARMMATLHWEQTLCLFKLMGFSDQLVESLLSCGPWLLCLSPNQSMMIVKQYRLLTVEQARSRALLWPQDGLLLD
ncbi:DUF2336 domain-containing protein [Cohaesibacter sp. CAU 1516]|uniref:DUF2336 domain-containing protein n=1 Tax=Cohaesibacter sp. CAU 1516 TaxID=2576038 RepID=UPI0010FCDF9A|nr:DUF2336 domain-containing protein [Cohaesibacter sp. CAU 1516]TLP48378.1 DUF2336 domain-containing protein [Cohaesibacter sp. CAU 1516]